MCVCVCAALIGLKAQDPNVCQLNKTQHNRRTKNTPSTVGLQQLQYHW